MTTISDELREAILGKDKFYWDAYDQGRLARHLGATKQSNPWRHPALPGHSDAWWWDRGWDRGL